MRRLEGLSNVFVLFPIVFPFIAAVAVSTIKFRNEKWRNIFIIFSVIINFISIILILNTEGLVAFHLWTVNNFLDIYFKIDEMGIFFSILASILWIFTAFYAIDYMKHEGREKIFFVFFILTLGITVGIAFSGNLFTLYIFYELLTLATFPLVIHSGSKEALDSGKKYLIYSFGGATLILLGMILLFSINSNMDFVARGVLSGAVENANLISIVYALMFLGFGVKAAIVPFHSWLPGAMVAPTPVSALLHAVAVVKSGIFAIIRISYFIFGAEIVRETHDNIYLSILIVITILLGSLLALHQENLKKRLAYSTISQLGYILLGIILLNENALIGGLLHLVNHAVIKITLFFCAGAIYFTTGKKNISDIRGIGRKMPVTMWCFAIAAISLIGIPPTNGSVSKWYLALGGLNANKILFVVILLLSAFLTAAYLLPIVIAAFFPGGDKVENESRVEPPPRMLIPIVMLTGVVVFLGFFPNAVLSFIGEIVRMVI
ncbi:MAG: multicomponent Na+:H+ antiporter subunit [Clostridiales bacterium]|jgi:multicomponent Na+:H+ antiporter subunit D|nr:multicomponent Na+:H+ antiporter subunit [Clostridiales bacterium]MDK2933921.1 multicomponent Na+:H+ antiporter subunit [Clostridiales bacterium]